jgi:tetratricopeptide (TPR) repeat protein
MRNSRKTRACSLFIIIIISALFATDCLAEDSKTYLERGIKAYEKDADFDKAISELQKAIELGLNETSDLVKARLFLGFAYIAKGKRVDAVVEFAKAINLDPELSLDPKIYSSKILIAFNETKASLVDSLTVISVPGDAEVFLDDKKVGVTPLKLNSVLTGVHKITISKEYFLPKTLDIHIYKAEENRVQVQLEKAEVEVRITSNPVEAFIYVSGNPSGKTPISLKISLDRDLSVKLAKEEYLDKELKLKLTAEGISIQGTDKVFPVNNAIADIQVELSPAPIPGSLKILSEPMGAIVYLDGVEKGQTPLSLPKITPGNREIRVSIPEFDTLTQKAEVISNKETEIKFILGGVVTLSSVPSDAQVFIDGKQIGITPLKTDRLSVGSHQVRFTKEKFMDKTITVLVERGQEKDVSIRLSAQKGSLAISSDPFGVDVYLNGEFKGNTPLFVYGLPIGEYSIRLTKTAFDDWNGKVVVKENEVSWLFGKLIGKQ